MRNFKKIQRREFLIIAGAAVGGTLVGHADKPNNTRIVSLKDAHIGTLDIDLRIMNQYVDQPQELLDFYTACRTAMTGDDAERLVAQVCQTFNRNKLGGPMLGDASATGVAVWMHLPKPDWIQVVVSAEDGGVAQTFQSADLEQMHSVRCEGLLPDTAYRYEVMGSGGLPLGNGRFVTAPNEFSEKPFKIAFGTCYHKVGMYRPELMQLIRERGNRAMLILGDSAVDGRRNNLQMINVDYMLRNLSTPWQEMTANVPVSATWDDHDYWGDDTSGAYHKSKRPIHVDDLRQSWRSQWNNPERDTQREGIYFQTKIGPVHYIALDTRSCRVNEARGELNSYLGETQMEWLKEQIQKSTAECILISSGTMWSDNISAGKDSWGTWDTEGREAIFKVIDAKQKDTLVVLMSGDRHGARGFAIPRPHCKPIYELEAATMGGVPGPKAYGSNPEEQIFGYPGRTWAFGEFTFSKSQSGLQVVFRLVGEDGEDMETIDLSTASNSQSL